MVGRLGTMLTIIGLSLAPAVRAHAQSIPPVRSLSPTSKKASKGEGVPASHMPPAGMCRVWIDNVPPAQQPAPTDCPTAIRNRPPNARVIFADDDSPRRANERGDRERRDDGKGKRDGKRKKPEGNTIS